MHQEPEHEDYDDDDYNFYPHQDNQDNNNIPFSFDWNTWEMWLSDVLKEIIQQENIEGNTWTFTFPNYSSQKKNKKKQNPELNNNILYFGKNQYDEAIWKTKYFICNYFDIQYKNHFMAHAAHIIKQPNYYRSMFDILN